MAIGLGALVAIGALVAWPSPGVGDTPTRGNAEHRALYAGEAAQRLRMRIEELRQEPDPPCAEIERLQGYLERVEAQLAADGDAAREGGSASAVAGKTPSTPARSRFQPVPVITEQELLRRKELELQEALGRFDQLLLREVEVASERSAERSSRAAEGSGGATGGEGDGQSNGASGQGGGDAGSTGAAGTAQSGEKQHGSGSAQANEDGRSGPGGRGSGPRVPPDIPDGSDDDIVARQIRAAAEAEQDPALREKLWQEYRDYKNSQR